MLSEPLPMASRTLIMGILNITPDSFSDGGKFLSSEAAVEHALALEAEGADLIDIGGESTRPGSEPVGAGEQLQRVLPVIESLRQASRIPISIDTTRAEVAEAALGAGAELVNDISALRDDPEMSGVVSRNACPVILMHMQGQPRTMQAEPVYHEVVEEVSAFLVKQRQVALTAGIAPEKIILDPGFGFGKTVEHNLVLLAHLDRLVALGSPVLVGFSRKATIGAVLDLP
ncbi:MAG: dihydropteroate synthase, partial [Planctomycetes bacterium]|nr:dihydropteroate synthase [Planctomycetota bacterium]